MQIDFGQRRITIEGGDQDKVYLFVATLGYSRRGINNLFHLRRHQVSATQYRAARTQAFQAWAEVTGVAAAA